MIRIIYRIAGMVEFPEGVMPGEGRGSNILSISRNGAGKPVLRGSSLAGALRAQFDDDAKQKWFGRELSHATDQEQDSRVKVADAVLRSGDQQLTTLRTHNMINRHTGVVVDGALFSIETLPPGTTCPMVLYVDADASDQSDDFIDHLLKKLGAGISLGGNRNRGIGRMVCSGNTLTIHSFNLSNQDGYGAWIDARHADRLGKEMGGGEKRALVADDQKLTVNLVLGIPRGEDICVGFGTTAEHQAEPQKVMKSDGKEYWRIPGSSIRGVFRSWITHLAARDEGCVIHDSAERWDNQFEDGGQKYAPHLAGWAFKEEDEQQDFKLDPPSLNDPILELFGSCYARGKIHVSDAISRKPAGAAQVRMHVGIDRFSGGANEGALFSNTVITSAQNPEFSLSITLESPTEQTVRWLEKTLRAMHLGILTFGSSKSAGRLEIMSIDAVGSMSVVLHNLVKEIQA